MGTAYGISNCVGLYRAGVKLLRIGMPTPLGPELVVSFAEGLEEIVVVEDKTAFVETQVREILYGRTGAPRIVGKKDAAGRLLIPVGGELTAGRLLGPLRRELSRYAREFSTLRGAKVLETEVDAGSPVHASS